MHFNCIMRKKGALNFFMLVYAEQQSCGKYIRKIIKSTVKLPIRLNEMTHDEH